MAIIDGEGSEVHPGQVGEIWVSGPSVAAGYWNDPKTSDLTFGNVLRGVEGFFLRTGDLGCIRDGHILTGRIKDLLVVNGRNIYPQDLEATAEECSKRVVQGRCAPLSLCLQRPARHWSSHGGRPIDPQTAAAVAAHRRSDSARRVLEHASHRAP